VFRALGPSQFAVLALIRGTIGLLNYISLGLAPAMIHEASQAVSADTTEAAESARIQLRTIYANGLFITIAAGFFGLILAGGFALVFGAIFRVPVSIAGLPSLVFLLGAGTLFRLLGDVPGAVLQIRSHIARDNVIVAAGDLAWMAVSVAACVRLNRWLDPLQVISLFYCVSGAFAFCARLGFAARETDVAVPRKALLNRKILRRLLAYGLLVVLAQLADYLYAPTDYILIDHLLSPLDIASYAPALQIDGALLLLVSGLSAVMLPRAAVAHASGEKKTVRRYYVIGTISSFILLVVVSVVAWLASPWIFRLWLGNPMVETQRILPMLLICTILGGSSMVGRSVLLAVGKVWPFTVAVLIAGVTNVVCSYVFVTKFGWGLRGIVLGTVVAVVARCGIWMPWYVMRVVNSDVATESVQVDGPAI
jgi:O-antigen/teichoic acid export membrane protein